MLRAPIVTSPGLATYSARDEFNQTTGNLTGKVAPVGGTWTLFGGDTDDYTIDTTLGVAKRTTAVGDTALPNETAVGRAVSVGTTKYASLIAQVDTLWTAEPNGGGGLLVRADSTTNYATVQLTSSGFLYVRKVIASSPSTVLQQPLSSFLSFNKWYTLRVSINAAGTCTVWLFDQGGLGLQPTATIADPSFATGQALDDGMFGLVDGSTGSAASRYYDNFSAWVPTTDAVAFASQSAQVTTRGAFREDSTGTAYGPVSWVEGDLPRLPVSGRESRTVQVMVKPSRGDFATQPDLGIDDCSVQGNYRPCWLYVPSPWTPDLLAPEVWCRPETLGAQGSAIAAWNNEGSGADLAQGTGANQPTVQTGQLDGQSVARFDSTDFLNATVAADASFTFFIVAKQTLFLASRALWSPGAGTAELRSGATDQWAWNSNQAAGVVNLGGQATAWTLITLRINSTASLDAYINGGAAQNFDPADAVTTGTSYVLCGGPFVGDVAETLRTLTALSDSDLNKARGYFSRKYPTLGSFGT